jgi:hypothetical protein
LTLPGVGRGLRLAGSLPSGVGVRNLRIQPLHTTVIQWAIEAIDKTNQRSSILRSRLLPAGGSLFGVVFLLHLYWLFTGTWASGFDDNDICIISICSCAAIGAHQF